MFNLVKTEATAQAPAHNARLGVFETPHGAIETPCFMNVATAGAIKGGLAAEDLQQIGTQVMLCNTYHLRLRPGDEIVRELGGIRKFTSWTGPVLTDSGGFQVYSLAKLRGIKEEGVTFASHISGERLFMGPEESMQIQSNLASTIAMAFDECIANPKEDGGAAHLLYCEASAARTVRWLERCKAELERLAQLPGTLNPAQMLFGINQGGTYAELRKRNMHTIVQLDLPGYAIGGLAVGESAEEMYRIIEAVEPLMPQEKPRYLMGVGTPVNILEAISRGIDLFDCVMPSRNARHGHIFTWGGIVNLNNAKYANNPKPIDSACGCPACQKHSLAYLHHLLKSGETLGLRLCVLHNLWFYNHFFADIRQALAQGKFGEFYGRHVKQLGERI